MLKTQILLVFQGEPINLVGTALITKAKKRVHSRNTQHGNETCDLLITIAKAKEFNHENTQHWNEICDLLITIVTQKSSLKKMPNLGVKPATF